jgi:hypothetical protein
VDCGNCVFEFLELKFVCIGCEPEDDSPLQVQFSISTSTSTSTSSSTNTSTRSAVAPLK